MDLYRAGVRWSNGAIELRPAGVYQLTSDEVVQVNADCPASLTPLDVDEVAALIEPLKAAGIQAVSFRPPSPDHSGSGRGAGDGAMTSSNMTGLVAR